MLNKTKLAFIGITLTTTAIAHSATTQAASQAEQVLSLFSAMDQQASPAATAGSPTGFGSGWGVIYGGASIADYSQTSSQMDATTSLGIGLGDPRKYVGLDVTVSAFGTGYANDTLGNTGDYSFKMSRFITDNAAVAIGVDNAFTWGDTDSTQSWYGVASEEFPLLLSEGSKPLPLTLSVGYGTGSYQSDTSSDDEVANTDGLFGAVGLQLNDQFSVILDWTGEMINSGVSFVPVKSWPLVTSLTATDLSNRTGNKVPVIFSAGYSYSF